MAHVPDKECVQEVVREVKRVGAFDKLCEEILAQLQKGQLHRDLQAVVERAVGDTLSRMSSSELNLPKASIMQNVKRDFDR